MRLRSYSLSLNFFYRILAYSLDYDVYLSEVRQTQFPEVTFNLSSVTQIGQKMEFKGTVSNLSNNGYLRMCMADYPAVPVSSNYSSSVNYSNGTVNGTALAYRTLKKQNIRLFGRDNETGAFGYSSTYAEIIPESFESSNYSYANTWSTNYFYLTSAKAKTGTSSLGSSEFSGSSSGSSAYATLDLTVENSTTFSFCAAHSYFNGAETFEFYIDGQLANNLHLTENFVTYSYPVGSGTHTFQWKVTKYTNSNYSGRVFIDDVTIGN